MALAGAGVVAAMVKYWPQLIELEESADPPSAVILCGPGNNGGDGYVVAQHLALRGWDVEILRDPSKLPQGAAGTAMRSLPDTVTVQDFAMAATGHRPDILVDALFGIGCTRPLSPEHLALFTQTAARPPRRGLARWRHVMKLVAVDCPSGLDLDRGVFLAPDPVSPKDTDAFEQWSAAESHRQIAADLCVTFHQPKPGHVMSAIAGRRLEVVDIGLPDGPSQDAASLIDRPKTAGALRLVDPVRGNRTNTFRRWYQSITRLDQAAHKYQRGHAMVLSGGLAQGGAARMAARAALRIGAGAVTIAAPQSAIPETAAQINALMLRALPDSYTLRGWMADERLRALCLGPGLGHKRAQEMVPAVLWGKRATVLDADALSCFSEDPSVLFNHLHPNCILTPHEGEFRTLFPDLAAGLGQGKDRIEITRRAAERAGAVVLLKGAVTVIARPDGCASVHPAIRERAVPWLATAGAGDVLAGMITGLLATQPPEAVDLLGAAELAVWMHVEAARQFGPGLIAEDLPDELPALMRSLFL
ncbi:NAD(P)H-hydrate dehydratase [Thioclava sp. 'Guangxiensis']|uniref:NAD(P)H-hydrate dehydratase n=1 Tax=Thioclava sp. 'Guangxiensis' TaxID=3149044 RepID=UPI003877F19C